MKKDIFISHATKDKPTIVLPLYTQLKTHKLNPWIDKEDIRHSDSLFEAINRGLRDSLYAVAIISPSFVGNSWTNAELQAIFGLMNEKRIIRLFIVYHEIDRDELIEKYPLLVDNLAFDSSEGVEAIAKQISSIILTKNQLKSFVYSQKSDIPKEPSDPTLQESFYFVMNMQYEVQEVENSFLSEFVKRLTDKEKEQLVKLVTKDLILNSDKHAKLYEEVVLRIPHRGSDDVGLDLSLIEDYVLVAILAKSLELE